MTDTPVAVDQPAPIGHTPPVSLAASQGTTIEQSRAVAEAQAAVILAQTCKRDVHDARARMLTACSQPYVAEDAFYNFKRGTTRVRGLTVDIARMLAGCWGNIEFGITELARDDRAGVSEMKAWAWDVETNTRASSTFIVPHRRDRTEQQPDGSKKAVQDTLDTLRDVQDNNANIAGRRLRQALFSVLPAPFVEEARVEIEKTIRKGDGKPLPDRIAAAIEVFSGLGVDVDRIEQKLGKTSDRWTEFDVVELVVSHRSIMRGEATADDEFPQRRVTAADIDDPPEPDPPGAGEDVAASPAPGSPPDPPAAPTEAELRDALKAKKLTIGNAMKVIQGMYPDAGLGTIGDVAAHPEAGLDLADWIDQQ